MINRMRTWADLVKFEHTIFALPFAYVGAFLAARGWPGWHDFIWITVAMVGARTAAMSVNRLADRRIDAKNPRTAGRHLPAGQVSATEATLLVVFSIVLLGLAAWQLKPICVALFPAAAAMVVLYSYTKRVSWLCHLFLGLTDAWAPFGGWIAVSGKVEWGAVLLALAVALWIGGFDILYATQDLDFDRKERLHSIPARFGLKRALQVAKAWHLGVVSLFMLIGLLLHLSWPYWVGWAAVAALLHYEHNLLSPDDMSKLGVAFMNVNGYLSVLYFVFSAAAVLVAR